MDASLLSRYEALFAHLRVDRIPGRWPELTRGRAPHKPILLLAVIDLIAECDPAPELIEPGPQLGELFTLYWGRVMPADQRGSMVLPFFHLRSEGFWHLVPVPGKEAVLASIGKITSLSQLRDLVLGARLDEELFALFSKASTREALRTLLIRTYFAPEAQTVLLQQAAINEDAYEYSRSLLADTVSTPYMPDVRAESQEAVRDQGFRRAIVAAYEHRCAFCSLRVMTADGHTAVDAAHIVPWSISKEDHISNGLALCKLCHWSFDEGLVSVSKRLTVLVSRQLEWERNVADRIRSLEGSLIRIPTEARLHPSQERLGWHRRERFRPR